MDEADILEQLADFEALLIMRERTPMTKNIIDNLSKLKFIITSGLRNNSIDLYSSLKSLYLQDRENKIKNSVENDEEWGNLDN